MVVNCVELVAGTHIPGWQLGAGGGFEMYVCSEMLAFPAFSTATCHSS